jgi:hypothetical protein
METPVVSAARAVLEKGEKSSTVMSDEAPLLELFKRLAPKKENKWAGWVQRLEVWDIDSEEDVLGLSEIAIDQLPITEPLKDILRKFRQVTDKTNEDDGTSLPQPSAPGVAGKKGPLSIYLSVNEKFVPRCAELDTMSRSLQVTHEGKTATDGLRIGLEGATIDRCPDFDELLKQKRRMSSRRKPNSSSTIHTNHMYTFRVRQQDGKKEVVLQANNLQIFTGWTDAIEEAGATRADTKSFEAKLSNPEFTVVPIGGPGVGKSTFCNLISGAQWLAENGFLQGYEDAMFKTSSLERQYTATPAVLLREWCGLSRISFAVMDTPALFESDVDTANIRSIVEELKAQQYVNCFMLLLDTDRFSPQQAQALEVLDRILSSANAGSFLEHTVIILNRAQSRHFHDEEGTKAEWVSLIKRKLWEQMKQGDEMQQLGEESKGVASMYENDRLFDGLRQRTFLFPGFGAKSAHAKAEKALKGILACVSDMESFDCTGVHEATRWGGRGGACGGVSLRRRCRHSKRRVGWRTMIERRSYRK